MLKHCALAERPLFFEMAYDTFNTRRHCDELLASAARHGLPRPRQLLDIGCGTGRELREFARRSIEAQGLDHDAATVRAARLLARQHRVRVGLRCADMRRFRLRQPVDLVVCLGATFNAVIGRDDAAAVFASCADALRPGGLFEIELYHNPSVFGNDRVARWIVRGTLGEARCRFLMRRPLRGQTAFRCEVIIDADFYDRPSRGRAVFSVPSRPWSRTQLVEIAEANQAFELVAWRVRNRHAQAPDVLAIFRRNRCKKG